MLFLSFCGLSFAGAEEGGHGGLALFFFFMIGVDLPAPRRQVSGRMVYMSKDSVAVPLFSLAHTK